MHEPKGKGLRLLPAVAALLLAHSVQTAQEKPAEELGGADKAEILRVILEHALLRKEIPDYKYIKDFENVLISTENIEAGLLPKFEGIKFAALGRDEIQERAEEDGNYVYHLEFEKFKVGDGKVTTALKHNPMYAKRPHPKYADKPRPMAFGGELGFECRKQDGEWACEVKYTAIASNRRGRRASDGWAGGKRSYFPPRRGE